ncbi:trk system potassium uptake protein TrkA [Antricoccus suffuscus]|uniref:Trk system potassium uptake protein TrkA n=1 Tax=Antricoccus suffuscus TaxID=1629062 RepID=A0A2T1A532_9ACTN|nr:TrkA family potassium uptake protein [Antricoccus suffuscus]PRZ43664.1 trk system potassium uptake protein TrkA [Antricoccus suffuscus]
MHIVIMGCGRVGSSIAKRLDKLTHSVSVIDQNPESFRRLGPEFRGDQVKGVGFDRETLIEAGIEKATAFAAVSSGDNSNIISARVAREIFGVKHVVARIYDSKRAEVYERLGIPTVATVPWTADRLFRELMADKNEELWRDATDAVSLNRVQYDEGWIGRTVTNFEENTGFRIALLTRFGKAILPTRSTVIQHGDGVFALSSDESRVAAFDLAGNAPEEPQS